MSSLGQRFCPPYGGGIMDVLMPQLGETVAEGKISTWFKTVGEAVKPGDNLFEIETDKVSMEVPAITSGVLAEIRVAAGETAPVGAIVAVISDRAGATTSPQAAATGAPPKTPAAPPKAPAPARAAPAPAASEQPKSAPRAIILDPFREVRTPTHNFGPARLASGAVTTPLARRLAGEAGIDLSGIKGSGPHGRIVARDVTAVATRVAQPAAAVARGPGADQIKALYRDTPYDEVPVDNMRRTIATRLTRAVQTIPHFYLTADVGLDSLLRVRDEANKAAPKQGEEPAYRLSVNDFVIKGLALALQRAPAANAVWAEDRILRFRHSDIGVAVALEGGLLTPVIRRAEVKSLSAISAEMKDLATRARERKLKPAEYQGGSTAISNLGMYGIRDFTAIINPPHATILAVGAAQRRPVEAEGGSVRFVSRMSVTLSCDHRVVDGALGAELLAAFRGFIEQPVTMLV
jgi:pyruvate dehydrogenase E2 component (dihydrolipoamide acetyltransferase)